MKKHHARQIFGMSDSASLFVPESREPVFGQKMVELANRSQPTICYMGAAKGDNPDRISEFVQLAKRVRATPKILSLFDPFTGDENAFFEDVDIIFIDGGSTRNLLALFREWNVISALRKAYDDGVVVAGASAGLNILFDWSITDSVKSDIRPIAGMGVLAGSVCVHYKSHPKRPEIFGAFLKSAQAVLPAYALDDGVAAHFKNEEINEIFSVSPGAEFNCFSKNDGQITCSSMPTIAIGDE